MTLDLAAQQASLDVMYGPTSGDLTVHLLDGDGVEVTGDGYTPGVLDELGWDATGGDGVKWASAVVDCGTPTDAWSATVTQFELRDASDVSWGRFPLPAFDVGGAGSVVAVLPGVFFGDLEID
jgi:hypothetical protein